MNPTPAGLFIGGVFALLGGWAGWAVGGKLAKDGGVARFPLAVAGAVAVPSSAGALGGAPVGGDHEERKRIRVDRLVRA